jgi:hypothetical protein
VGSFNFGEFQEQEQKANASSNMSVYPSATNDIRVDAANLQQISLSTKSFSRKMQNVFCLELL